MTVITVVPSNSKFRSRASLLKKRCTFRKYCHFVKNSKFLWMINGSIANDLYCSKLTIVHAQTHSTHLSDISCFILSSSVANDHRRSQPITTFHSDLHVIVWVPGIKKIKNIDLLAKMLGSWSGRSTTFHKIERSYHDYVIVGAV